MRLWNVVLGLSLWRAEYMTRGWCGAGTPARVPAQRQTLARRSGECILPNCRIRTIPFADEERAV
jgi:hypothetical protein